MFIATLFTIPRNGIKLKVYQWTIDEENLVDICYVIIFTFTKEGNFIISDNMGRPGEHYSK
jgi:hypothetical protein